jgi:hypothetical protein
MRSAGEWRQRAGTLAAEGVGAESRGVIGRSWWHGEVDQWRAVYWKPSAATEEAGTRRSLQAAASEATLGLSREREGERALPAIGLTLGRTEPRG